MEDQFWMISMYRMTHQKVSKDLLEMFDEYPALLWVSIIGSLVLFIIALAIGRYFLEKKRQVFEPIWIISMFTLDQDYLDESNNFLFVLSTCLSFSCFFITQYLLNNMGTDLVVIQDPQVLGSYEDVIKRPGTIPLFLKGWPDSEEFKNSALDSMERKLWDHAEKVSKNGTKGDPFTELGLSIFNYGKQMLAQNVTLILSKVIARVVTRMTVNGLLAQGEMEDERFLISKNPTAKVKNVAFLGAPDIEREFYHEMYRKCQKMIEVGFIKKVIDNVVDGTAEPRPSLLGKVGWKIEKTEKGDPDSTIKIRFKNVHQTFRLVSIAYAIGIIVLLVEISYKKSEIRSKDNNVLFKPVNRLPSVHKDERPNTLRAMAQRKDAVIAIKRMQRDLQNFRLT